MLRIGLSGESLNRTPNDLGLVAASGQQSGSVVPTLSSDDAVVMERSSGTPMLRFKRITRCADGGALGHVDSFLDPTRLGLRIDP